ncbi:MAG: tol-pal system-associated acyl-CoA thioesterase [Wenzhouxiangellaceae bacterium]
MTQVQSGAAQATASNFSWPVRVYWEDTDAGGVVYHARYLHFFERARTEWLRAMGFDQQALRDEHGILFVVSKMTVDYLRPGRLDDSLDVSVELTDLGKVSMTMEQVIRRGDEPIAKAVVYAGCLDAQSFTISRIPPFILSELQ